MNPLIEVRQEWQMTLNGLISPGELPEFMDKLL